MSEQGPPSWEAPFDELDDAATPVNPRARAPELPPACSLPRPWGESNSFYTLQHDGTFVDHSSGWHFDPRSRIYAHSLQPELWLYAADPSAPTVLSACAAVRSAAAAPYWMAAGSAVAPAASAVVAPSAEHGAPSDSKRPRLTLAVRAAARPGMRVHGAAAVGEEEPEGGASAAAVGAELLAQPAAASVVTAPVPSAALPTASSSAGAAACTLCRRGFPNLESLQRHIAQSALHRDNLRREAEAAVVAAAAAATAAQPLEAVQP